MPSISKSFAAVLFDLDGTLADTAADLAAPVNQMRIERGLPALPLDALRPFASAGARGLLGAGLGVSKDAAEFPALRDDFLRRYEANLVVHSALFGGMTEVLAWIEAQQIPWGVVSNKVERYVKPIVQLLGLHARSQVAIGGDTTAFAKPHPEPLLHACRLMQVAPERCIYVGDDLRDIQAGKAAGMATVAAAYGYCGDHDPAHAWGADYVIEQPMDLIAVLQSKC